MSETAKRLLAVVGAIALVAAAVGARLALDEKEAEDSLVLRLVCSTDLADACTAAAAADPRVRLTVEPVATTYARVAKAADRGALAVDAWLTSAPWATMADGARGGAVPLFAAASPIASTPVDLAGFGERAEVLRRCAGGAAACTAKAADGPWTAAGGTAAQGHVQPSIGDPTTDSVALAALAKIVVAGLAIAPADLDRNAIEQSDVVARLKRSRPSGVGPAIPEISGSKGGAGAVPVAVARATLSDALAGRVLASAPDVAAVVQLALADEALRPVADLVVASVAATLRTQRWTVPAGPSGLPDPGALAALRDAWASA